MHIKRLLSLIPGLIFLFLASNLSAQITYYVRSDASPGASGLTWSDACASIQEALNKACENSPAEIWVAAGTYVPEQTASGDASNPLNRNNTFKLCNGVKIIGGFTGNETSLQQRNFQVNQTILSGDLKRNDGVFGIAGTVLFNNSTRSDNAYTVVNASGTDSTTILDGLYIMHGNANGSEFSNESGPDRAGGGVYSDGGNPRIQNCSFALNAANGQGGAIFCKSSTAEISGCTFKLNMGKYGAGVYANNASIKVTNCDFLLNAASSGGAGMYSAIGSPLILGNTFNRNFAGLDLQTGVNGAGLFIIGGSPQVDRCNFLGNEASLNGGGLYVSSANLVVSNSLFNANVAWFNGGNGGGFCAENNVTGSILNCTFSGNRSSALGGAVSNGQGCNLRIENSIIWHNQSNAATNIPAASIANQGNAGTSIKHCIVANSGGSSNWNAAIGTDEGNNLDQDPLFLSQPEISPTGAQTSGNMRLKAGSPALNSGNSGSESGALDLDGNPRTISSMVDMGAYEYQGTPALGAVIYVDSRARGYADGSSWDRAMPYLHIALETACNSSPVSIWVAEGTYNPGGLRVQNTNTSFRFCSDIQLYGGFSGNETSLDQRNNAPQETVLSADASYVRTFPDNSLNDNMKVILQCENVNDQALIDGFTFYGANGGFADAGGAIFNKNASQTIRNCIFLSNKSSFGGAISNDLGSSPLIRNCHFEKNQAQFEGGGISNFRNSRPRIEKCTFDSNMVQGGDGAAIANRDNSNALISDCLFEKNIANGSINKSFGSGGAISNFHSMPVISNCRFINNTVTGSSSVSTFGGAVYAGDTSDVTLVNCVFSGNYNGLNFGDNVGGALATRSSKLNIVHCTFSGNKTTDWGGAIYLDEKSEGKMTNSICWNNIAGTVTSGPISNSVYLKSGAQMTTSFSIIEHSGGSANWNGSAGIDGGNNQDLDPLFLVPADPGQSPLFPGDLRLQEGSPAINAGTADIAGFSWPETDVAGSPRIQNGSPDLGAYEFGVMGLIDLKDNLKYTLYPNPATQKVYFKFDQMAERSIRFYDISGRLIQEAVAMGPLVKMDIGAIRDGVVIYTIVEKSGKMQHGKFIVLERK